MNLIDLKGCQGVGVLMIGELRRSSFVFALVHLGTRISGINSIASCFYISCYNVKFTRISSWPPPTDASHGLIFCILVFYFLLVPFRIGLSRDLSSPV